MEIKPLNTVHVVSSPGTSSTSAPEARVSTSTSSASAPTVEVPSSVGASSHGVVSPVVAVVSTALTWWWPHHAWATARIEGWSMVVRGKRVVEAGTTGWVATIHGHLHVHIHVVHPWTMAQQTLVD